MLEPALGSKTEILTWYDDSRVKHLNAWWESAMGVFVSDSHSAWVHAWRVLVRVRTHALTRCRVDGYALKQHSLVA